MTQENLWVIFTLVGSNNGKLGNLEVLCWGDPALQPQPGRTRPHQPQQECQPRHDANERRGRAGRTKRPTTPSTELSSQHLSAEGAGAADPDGRPGWDHTIYN